MRPNLVAAAAAALSLAALPALAQTGPSSDRYGSSAPRVAATPAAGYLTWTGKAQQGAMPAAGRGAPQLLPNGLLAHSSVVSAPSVRAPVAPTMQSLTVPQVAAPRAPVLAAPISQAPQRATTPASPTVAEVEALSLGAPNGLLGLPPVRNPQGPAAGAL